MDGTLYLGEKLLPGAKEILAYLNDENVPYFLLTNNSSRSKMDYVDKLAKFGLEIPEEKIFPSGEATAIYLTKQKPKARLYVVGTPSLEKEFTSHGFELVEEEPDYAVLGLCTAAKKLDILGHFIIGVYIIRIEQ